MAINIKELDFILNSCTHKKCKNYEGGRWHRRVQLTSSCNGVKILCVLQKAGFFKNYFFSFPPSVPPPVSLSLSLVLFSFFPGSLSGCTCECLHSVSFVLSTRRPQVITCLHLPLCWPTYRSYSRLSNYNCLSLSQCLHTPLSASLPRFIPSFFLIKKIN